MTETPTQDPAGRPAGREDFYHEVPTCQHDFVGWREFEDGRGGERVCKHCGMGAMEHTLREGF